MFVYVFPVLVGDLLHAHTLSGRFAENGHKWPKTGFRTDPRGSIKVGGA